MEKFGDVIDDSLSVGQRRPQDTDERILLFVKLRPGHDLTPVLERGIKDVIRRSLSARHVPSFIFAVEDIPVSAVTLMLSGISTELRDSSIPLPIRRWRSLSNKSSLGRNSNRVGPLLTLLR